MEFVMKKIMSIDKDAENYRKGTYDLIKEKKYHLETTIKNMRVSFEEESKNIKSGISNEKIMDAELKAKNIRAEKEEGISSITTKYQNNKLVIIDEVFNKIIKSL